MPRAKSSQLPADLKLIEGAEKRLGSATLIIAGETYTAGEIVALIRERTVADAAVQAAHAALKTRIAESRAKHEQTDAIVAAFRQVVHGMFAGGFEALCDFGLVPRKPRRELTAEEKVAMVAKVSATRAARHTMGKRAKLKIKGIVPPAPPPPALSPAVDASPRAPPATPQDERAPSGLSPPA